MITAATVATIAAIATALAYIPVKFIYKFSQKNKKSEKKKSSPKIEAGEDKNKE